MLIAFNLLRIRETIMTIMQLNAMSVALYSINYVTRFNSCYLVCSCLLDDLNLLA